MGGFSLEELRKKELSEISKQLSQLEHVRPVYDLKDYSHTDLLDKLKTHFDEVIKKTFELKDPISDIQQSLHGLDSKIIAAEEYQLLRKWLPSSYKSKQMQLLFQSQKDGATASSFHMKCDSKGPNCDTDKVSVNDQFFRGVCDRRLLRTVVELIRGLDI